jgi:hypothetical protein
MYVVYGKSFLATSLFLMWNLEANKWALQSKIFVTKWKRKMKMWHAHRKINKNCGYKNYFQRGLNPNPNGPYPL